MLNISNIWKLLSMSGFDFVRGATEKASRKIVSPNYGQHRNLDRVKPKDGSCQTEIKKRIVSNLPYVRIFRHDRDSTASL